MEGLSSYERALLTAGVISLYFIMLVIVARFTTRKNDNATFFTANRESPWYLVAFGMIGTSISGVTFISIPGEVGKISFSYFQIVLGYFFGYLVITHVLLPLYYRLNLISIYTYLQTRFGENAYKTGSFFFLLSRTLGSALRLFLAAMVFQIFIFDQLGFPFELSVIVSMALILLYSIRGGLKTIVFTDSLQTLFLVLSLLLTIYFISDRLGWSLGETYTQIKASPMSNMFFCDYKDSNFFFKQFLSGMFITITMTGLDQDLMQKNLTCKNLKEAQKNMFVFSIIILVANILFLSLGALLYMFAAKNGVAIPERTDQLFPTIAFNYFPVGFAFIFLIGLTAATFASTDSALAALTTSFCIDFLGFGKEGNQGKVSTRYWVHIIFGAIVVIIILIINAYFNNKSVISNLFKIAGYTYGPLLGLFSFGLFSKRLVNDKWIPVFCILAPLATYGLEIGTTYLFPDYKIGFESILINGLLVYMALFALSLGYPQNTADKKLHA
ncbi:MAG: sodium:solute symporter [Bacteroidia bacterium]